MPSHKFTPTSVGANQSVLHSRASQFQFLLRAGLCRFYLPDQDATDTLLHKAGIFRLAYRSQLACSKAASHLLLPCLQALNPVSAIYLSYSTLIIAPRLARLIQILPAIAETARSSSEASSAEMDHKLEGPLNAWLGLFQDFSKEPNHVV